METAHVMRMVQYITFRATRVINLAGQLEEESIASSSLLLLDRDWITSLLLGLFTEVSGAVSEGALLS